MRGLEDLDGGYVVLDFQRHYGIDLTDEVLEARTWRWFLARAYELLNIPDSLTRKAALRGV